jgi:hypothetical protein
MLVVGLSITGTFFRQQQLVAGKRRAWRTQMIHLLLNASPLFLAGEFALGLSLTMFLRALIIAFGDRIDAR